LPLPTEPGLGVELDRDALASYAADAQALSA
jgi:L-alanine-DL-glutamate epimerase-like enolase superfamily enzyme